ncbi:secernin-1 [Wyeomyia smithii]|uniref:secernin-1 n=1 Tax=Wyeomyia smithii TaxID=174621 RepID=UPI002467BA3E|nr:secernin-1 [Wyeomyia smithii]XP_055541542.1 secernin-1 [Wyeomyia smithii]
MSGICGEVFIVLIPATESDQMVIFGRNGMRPASDVLDDVTEVCYCPASAEASGKVICNSVEIDGAASYSMILNQPAGVWGAESGSNEKGVIIGLTFSEGHPVDGKLNATDLVRLGLERGATASEAVDRIVELNASAGPSGETKESAKASFVICDCDETWLLDIVGCLWAAQKLLLNNIALKPGLVVGKQIDRSSDCLASKLQTAGIWDGSGELNFSSLFGYDSVRLWPTEEPVNEKPFGICQMFETLRAAGLQTKSLSSHVSVLSKRGLSSHWFTATPNPAESVFKPFIFTSGAKISPLTKLPANAGEKQTLLHKLHSNRKWEVVGGLLQSLESECVDEVNRFISDHSEEPNHELDELLKDCVEAEVKFYR